VQINTASPLLRHLMERNRCAVALVGLPGVGKTQIVQQTAQELGLEYRPVEMAFYQTEDLCGMPYRDGDRTLWTKPAWFPETGEGVLSLEDMNRLGDPNVLNCLMTLLLDRRLHTYPLPAGWRVTATLNVGSQFLISRLDLAHISRVAIIEVETNIDSVLRWGETYEAHPAVLAFLRANPTYLMQLPTADGQKPWPNPRSWFLGVGENLPQEINHETDQTFLQALVSTFVGESAAFAFVAWLCTTLPSCQEILDRPLSSQMRFRFTTDTGLLLQRLTEFEDYLPKRGFRLDHFEHLKQYLSLIPADALAGFLHTMQRKHPNLAWTQRLMVWKYPR